MPKALLCVSAYLLLWLVLSASPAGKAGSSWQLAALVFSATGPMALISRKLSRYRFFIYSWLFFRAILTMVLVYSSAASPAPSVIMLTVFAFETVFFLDRRWPLSFSYLCFILLFILILPRRAYGAEITLPPLLFFFALSVYLSLATVSFHKILQAERELERRERELASQRDLIDQVYLLNSQFQEYALNAERKSAEEERKRITRDIHDIMGYTLVNLRVMLEVALDLAGDANGKLSSLLSDAIKHTQEGLQSARKALRNLRVIEETSESWMNRMYRIVSTFSGATGVAVNVSWGNVTRANCPHLKNAVYQFVQESLTNSFKHGKASSIEIEFRIAGTTPNDSFIARIIDDGQGAKDTIIPGIGFQGIQERIVQLEGQSGYRNLENGFEVWISIPMLSMRKDI